MAWNDENTERLRQLVDAGLPASIIGRHLGCSRNAVIGKCHRIGLFLKVGPGHQPGQTAKPSKIRHQRIQIILLNEKKRQSERDQAMMKQQDFPPVPPDGLTVKTLTHFHALPGQRTIGILELDSRTCRWPLDVDAEHRYCGGETFVGSPYCAHHTIIASRR